MLRFLSALLFFVLSVTLARALDKPQGGFVLLTVSGEITAPNGDGVAEFDRALLESLDWREIETYTSFTEGPQRVAGPTLESLLEAVGAQGSSLTAWAINDYSITIPIEHARDHNVILAMEMNGARMRVRDKGPIWVIYPLTEEQAAMRMFDGEMIWQLVRLRINP